MAMAERDYEGATEAKRDPRAQTIIKRLHVIQDQANMVRSSAGTTADKILGSEPQAVGENKLKEVGPSGFFGEVDALLSSIERTLSYAGEQLRRFEREF